MRDTTRSGEVGKRHTVQPRRGAAPIAAVVLALTATLGLYSGCSSTPTEAAGGSTSSREPSSSVAAPTGSPASGADCNVQPPRPSSIDGVFADVAGFTVQPICPADVDPYFADPQVLAGFDGTVAGQLSRDQKVVMTVFAGQLASGSGDTFVQAFLSKLSEDFAKAVPTKTVATDTQQLGGYPVTYFNVQLDVQGYIYAAGPTVVLATVKSGADQDTAKDAFTRILANLH